MSQKTAGSLQPMPDGFAEVSGIRPKSNGLVTRLVYQIDYSLRVSNERDGFDLMDFELN